MMRQVFMIFGVLALLFVAACANEPRVENPPLPRANDTTTLCPDVRPEFCTREYNPVCGDNNQTYGNGCEACSDPAVNSYEGGACAGTPDENGRIYQSRDVDECSRIKFACIPGMQPFSDETGCGCEPADDNAGGTMLAMIECTEPRPEVCTMQYDPVCGVVDTGVRCVTEPCPSTEYRTFGNSCSACSNGSVQGYFLGACEDLDMGPAS